MIDDKRAKKSGSVRPLANQLGIEIKFSPNHVMAKGYWTGAEPSAYDPDEDETAVDYYWTLVTAMVATDQHVQVSNILIEDQTEVLKTLIIDIPGAELWYVVPQTITDVDEDGTGVLIELVLHRVAAQRNLDNDVDVPGRVFAHGNLVDVHCSSLGRGDGPCGDSDTLC